MACRIDTATFEQIAEEERARADYAFSVVVDEDPAPAPMVRYDFAYGAVILHKKPIQALVDDAEQARPIIGNLLYWANEQILTRCVSCFGPLDPETIVAMNEYEYLRHGTRCRACLVMPRHACLGRTSAAL